MITTSNSPVMGELAAACVAGRLAPAHKAAAVEKLSAFNAMERKRQEPVILFPAGQEKPTGTTTDTEAKSAPVVALGNIQ